MKPTKQTVKVNESALDMFAKYGVKSIQKGSTEIKLVKSKKKMVKNIKKQTVYLPVKEDGGYSIYWGKDKIFNHAVMKEGYFFTPEELNEYTANVIKQTLETAAENAEIKERKVSYSSSSGSEYGYVQSINKKSITNTFEETYKKFEV